MCRRSERRPALDVEGCTKDGCYDRRPSESTGVALAERWNVALTGAAEFLREVSSTLAALDHDVLDRICERLFVAWREHKTVFVMGNGGSASTASHFAADLAKYTIISGKPRFKVLGLTDSMPSVSAWTNDSGWNSVYAEQLRPWVSAGDVLVGFSVHGGSGSGGAGAWSQNTVAAMQLAKDAGAAVIGFSGYDGGAMREMADECAVVPVVRDVLGTPLVEGIHVVLHHLVVHQLRERIEDA
jgi:D-sedoheptulose 7-phosphate isomerase